MAVKHSVGSIANSYSKLRVSLPDLEIDPRIYGPQAIDLLAEMSKTGPNFRRCASYLIEQDIKLYITLEIKGVSAGWHENASGERWISINRSLGLIDRLIVIGHETLHLQQSLRVRCSVEGEYHAWRFGYQLRGDLSASGTVIPMSADEQKLASMPDHPTRENLKVAQALIQKMAGPDYLIGKAPLQGKDWETALLAPALKIVNSILKRGELL
jgi:hypothetical protein